MSDLISIKDERFWDILFHAACVEGEQARRIEKELEQITVEPVRGEWEEATRKNCYVWSSGYARCSNCEETIWCGWEMNFCPNCGADMRGEKND